MEKNILCVVLSIAFFGAMSEGARCPGLGSAPTPRHFLNLDRIGGEWKMLRAGPPSASSNRSDVDCITYTISNNEQSIHFLNVLYKERVEGVKHEHTELATIKYVNLPLPSHWDLWAPDSYMPTDVVATDYDNFMILYMCNDLEGIRDASPVWLIFGRENTLDPVILDTLYWFIEGFGFPRNKFLEIGQTNCS